MSDWMDYNDPGPTELEVATEFGRALLELMRPMVGSVIEAFKPLMKGAQMMGHTLDEIKPPEPLAKLKIANLEPARKAKKKKIVHEVTDRHYGPPREPFARRGR